MDVKKDEIEASLAQAVSDVYDTFCRVKALHDFRATDGKILGTLEVFKRAKGTARWSGYENLCGVIAGRKGGN